MDSLNAQVIKGSFRLLTKKSRTIYMLSMASRLHRTKTIRDHIINQMPHPALFYLLLFAHVLITSRSSTASMPGECYKQ